MCTSQRKHWLTEQLQLFDVVFTSLVCRNRSVIQSHKTSTDWACLGHGYFRKPLIGWGLVM